MERGARATQGSEGRGVQMSAEISFAQLDLLKFYSFSAVGLMGTRLLLYAPMTLKTRLQTQERGTGVIGTLRRLGLRGLYRGALTVSLGIVPTQSLYLTVLETSKSKVSEVLGGIFAGRWQLAERMAVNASAGALGSCAAGFVGVPLDVVTQRMQLGQGTLTQVAGTIWRTKGPAGFYQGYWASLVTYAPTSACWWMTYSNMRAVLREKSETWPHAMTAVAGGTAGVTAAVVTNPLDVIKTRKQTAVGNPGLKSVAKELFEKEGVRGEPMRVLCA